MLRVVLEQQADLLEQALLARRLEVEQDVGFGQQFRDLVHGGSGTHVRRLKTRRR